VKQIVGSTLQDTGTAPKENFVSDHPAEWYAEIYQRDALTGGHVIMLGQGNEAAARAALKAYPRGLQIGGGIHAGNARQWIDCGATHVIVTSAIFDNAGHFQPQQLQRLVDSVGKDQLVLDLSCKQVEPQQWMVAMNRWQTLTDLAMTHATLDLLAQHCDEFLIHAVDVEGKCEGVDTALVAYLAAWGQKPMTYAGGARSLADLELVAELSRGKLDLTIGSALDLFGGNGAKYRDCVAFNQRAQ
jgi:phosphoribosylformimino-5-aminoimidazole carboxamide ribotide isomerase